MVFNTLKDRPTADLIVIFLTGVVGLTVLVFTTTVLVVEIKTNGKANTSLATSAIRGITSTLIAAIVGYIAGRGAPSLDKNGMPPAARNGTSPPKK